MGVSKRRARSEWPGNEKTHNDNASRACEKGRRQNRSARQGSSFFLSFFVTTDRPSNELTVVPVPYRRRRIETRRVSLCARVSGLCRGGFHSNQHHPSLRARTTVATSTQHARWTMTCISTSNAYFGQSAPSPHSPLPLTHLIALPAQP